MRITKHFRLKEFATKDGTPVPRRLIPTVREVAKNLQVLRDEIGKPIKITSAYRHLKYNRKIGSKDTSQHVKGRAVDIQVKGMSPRKVYEVILRLIREGRMKQGGVGLYDGFTHYDTRNFAARWCAGKARGWKKKKR